MGYNLALRCETCRAHTGVLRGYESAAIAIFGRDHPSSEGHVKKLQVDNGWSSPEEEWNPLDEDGRHELVYPPDYPVEDQPERFVERGY